ncbi:MAG: hypothetical protein HYY23_06990 [Verrucomicrobia bacterium]|nr:hypothetical protein [Verrucomicrobiota bacterium]
MRKLRNPHTVQLVNPAGRLYGVGVRVKVVPPSSAASTLTRPPPPKPFL